VCSLGLPEEAGQLVSVQVDLHALQYRRVAKWGTVVYSGAEWRMTPE
jgi:hypothetical protein